MKLSHTASITNMMVRKDFQKVDEALSFFRNQDHSQADNWFPPLARIVLNDYPGMPHNLYQYKGENIFLQLDRVPETPIEYYALSRELHIIKDQTVFTIQGKELIKADDSTTHVLQFSLWNDLARCGIDAAREAINHYAIHHGDKAASKYLILKNYNLFGYQIALPRAFYSADDLSKLGSALIICKGATPGKKLRTHFFELEDGKDAYSLGKLLIQKANEKRYLQKFDYKNLAHDMNYSEFNTCKTVLTPAKHSVCACLASNQY